MLWVKCGGGQTRTDEDVSREIYSLLPLPLGDTPINEEYPEKGTL